MTCLNCTRIAADNLSFCPYCGALLRLTPPSAEERAGTTPALLQRQKSAQDDPSLSPGPLLSGRVAIDAALGFMGEIVAFSLLVYAVWEVFRFSQGNTQILSIIGMLFTAVFLFWYTKQMRQRYPTFAKGWQTGRSTWGIGVEHLLTLIFGILMLCVLFPLGGLLICFGLSCGPAAWILALAIAYLFGMLARRMSDGGKKPRGTAP